MKLRTVFSILVLLVLFPFSAFAAEYDNGAIRLVIDEQTGRFSLYALNYKNNRHEPMALFVDQDPRTSFLQLIVNERSYKLGDTSVFRVRLSGTEHNPSLVFESTFMLVNQQFSFMKSDDSSETNGIKISFTLENRGDRQIMAGARFLLDTNLGESGFHLTTDKRTISSETLLTSIDGDSFWKDKNNTISVTGNLFTGSPQDPDSIHFANWKKLNDIPWKADYNPGKNFNLLPYSVGDSALCYYYEIRPLSRGEKRSFSQYIFLNSEKFINSIFKPAGESIQDIPSVTYPSFSGTIEQDMAAIKILINRINDLMASGASEEELAYMEIALNSLRSKYGSN